MATKIWIGNAMVFPHVVDITLGNMLRGDIVRLTINNKFVEYKSKDGTIPELAAGLASVWGKASFGEMKRVAPTSLYSLDGDNTTPVVGLRLSSSVGPFTVAATVRNLGSAATISVVETTRGSSGNVNEMQTIVLPRATGGTYTLTCGANTTGNLAWNADAPTVQTALQGLTSIGSGNVTVTGTGTYVDPFVLTFLSGKAATNMAQVTGDGTNLLGVADAFSVLTQRGGATLNEIQKVVFNNTVGSFQLVLNGIGQITQTFNPAFIANAAQAEAVINQYLGDSGFFTHHDLSVIDFQFGQSMTIEFINNLAATNLPTMSIQVIGVGFSGSVQSIQNGSSTGINAIETVTVQNATGGTFALSFSLGSNQTTSAIAYNASAITLQTALEALSNVGSGRVAVTGANGGPWTVSFQGTLASQDLPLFSVNGSLLSGGTIASATTMQGTNANTNEIQTVTLNNTTGGTFLLSFGGQTTAAIAWNAAASAVQTALQALSSIGASNAVVSGSAGGPYTVTFQGALQFANQPALIANAGSLTSPSLESTAVTVSQIGTGPNFWNDPDNWQDGVVPVTGDDVYVQDSDVDISFGLDQSAVTLNSLTFDQAYSGRIGLSHFNADGKFNEYNLQYLKIGATSIEIGRGEGSGSKLIKIDTGSVQTTLRINASGRSADTLPAVQWKGTHASNKVFLSKGDFGAAVFADELATINQFEVGQHNNRNSDAQFIAGAGCTVATLKKEGGNGVLYGPINTVVNRAGDLAVIARAGGNIASLRHDAGTFSYQATGTVTLADISGVIDFRQDPRPRTVTTLNLYSGAALHDPAGTVTYTNPIKFVETNPGPNGVLFDVPANITLVMAVLS